MNINNVAQIKNINMQKIETLKNCLIGLSFILVPLLLIAGFASHPNLVSLEVMNTGEAFAAEFHNNTLWFVMHIVIMFSALPFMGIMIGFNKLIGKQLPWIGLLVVFLGFFGSFMLGVDKGALALVPSAFDTLPEAQFQQLMPGLEAMINYGGFLWLAWLYLFIPVAMFIAALGLIKTKIIPRWQGTSLLVGSAMFFNPDIDLISLAASVLIAFALIPIGFSFLRNTHSQS